MLAQSFFLDQELRRILWVCLDIWKNQTADPEAREICYRWVSAKYQEKFGGSFHQSKLRKLAELGFLKEGDLVRAGTRRYYTILDPGQLEHMLLEWGMR